MWVQVAQGWTPPLLPEGGSPPLGAEARCGSSSWGEGRELAMCSSSCFQLTLMAFQEAAGASGGSAQPSAAFLHRMGWALLSVQVGWGGAVPR